MTGVNIDSTQLTWDRVLKTHKDNRLIGVWYSVNRAVEDLTMWERIFTYSEPIDFFFSDRPLEAMIYREGGEDSLCPESVSFCKSDGRWACGLTRQQCRQWIVGGSAEWSRKSKPHRPDLKVLLSTCDK